jgi:hypothetical protein
MIYPNTLLKLSPLPTSKREVPRRTRSMKDFIRGTQLRIGSAIMKRVEMGGR